MDDKSVDQIFSESRLSVESFFQPLQRFLQDGCGAPDIYALEAFTARAEHGSGIQPQACLVDQQVAEFLVRKAKFPEIQPYKVSALGLHKPDEREFLSE